MEFKVSEETYTILFKLVFSIAAGLLIGLEREHRTKTEIFAGIRTFPLISILGMLSALVADKYWSGILYFTFGGVVLLALINYFLEYKRDIGSTTEIATFIAFIIGILTYHEHYYIAAFLSVVTTGLLALKRTLEMFAKNISEEDLFAILKFALVTIVIYPLLPDRSFGPFDAFNPKSIWKMVVLVSVIDFTAYTVLRWKGTKTLWITGIIGGMISSTAVSYELSKLSKKFKTITYSALFGIVLAWLVMNFRVIILSGVVDFRVSVHLLFPLTVLSIFYIAVLSVIYIKNKENITRESQQEIPFTNPFQITSALQFGIIYAAVIFITKALQHFYGEKGVFIASFVSGIIDVDAITLSLSNMAGHGSLDISIAVKSIILAVISNSIFKYTYIAVFGNRELVRNMTVFLAITLIFGGFYLLSF
ncbi:MgtC/SapB family protein [Persephonella atlantica]|uniref:MgtC/SapB family protein n=1 Tax=Persephonella atlantica TaxID=2699429 RepID=A0ABS1GI76_9AQUI|nr:MgtC/SapB family protein [Persephonella atlantica]MBK3332608.1 MgtC/SapB family protein [Persephonella atlantica]